MRSMEPTSFVASSQTRPRSSGFLTPPADPSVLPKERPRESRKGTGDSAPVGNLLEDSIIVKPYPSTGIVKPRTLRPVALLNRSDLPLSLIDVHSNKDPLPASRLFEAHVKILELEQRIGSVPVVLIARLDDGKTFYAVEFASRGLFVVLKLGSWLDLDTLCANAISTKHESLGLKADKFAHTLTCQSMDAQSHNLEGDKYSKKKRLAIEAIQSIVKRPAAKWSSTPLPATTIDVQQTLPETSISVEGHIQTAKPLIHVDVIDSQPIEAAKALDKVRTSYLETLYLSKASLAYFAKGPLSRARAAYHLDLDSNLDMKELVEFLDAMILSSLTLDKKYRDTVPEISGDLGPGALSADELQTLAPGKKRRRKKMKLGKNGLYPSEESLIKDWLESYDQDANDEMPVTNPEYSNKTRLARLRIRETQLQLIVILETLALRSLVGDQGAGEPSLPSNSKDTTPADKSAVKSKKPKDFSALIDVHIDRLCIWQSIADEEGKVHNDKDSSGGVHGSGTYAADVLKDFCTGVIVPFFSARLPEKCAMISRKLGGPVVLSPARPSLKRSASTSGMPNRPGTAAKRTVAAKSRRSLHRVLTDERTARGHPRGPSGAISLMRSATAPSGSGFKREASETPSLSSIQAFDSQSMTASRGGVQKSKKFSQREVDLNNLSSASDVKNKKDKIEAELKEAIAALKRPNRQLAGQSLAETAERRASAAVHSKKMKKPVRNPLFQGVQILATPKANRHKDVMGESQPQVLMTNDVAADAVDVVPPSSIPRVSQSVIRSHQQSIPMSMCKETPARGFQEYMNQASIQATPSRQVGTASFGSMERSRTEPGQPPSSPIMARHHSKQRQKPAHHEGEISETPSKPTLVTGTPIRATFDTIINTPILNARTTRKEDGLEGGRDRDAEDDEAADDLYKTLGWDDVDELL